MKRLFVLILLAVLCALIVASWGGSDAGYILISHRGLSIEMTFWVGATFLLMSFVLFYYLARFLLLSARAVRWLGGEKLSARQHPRLDRTSAAAGYFIAGDWDRAEKRLRQAAVKSEAPLLNYLLAARAAHAAGDPQKAERYLGLAADQTKATDPSVLLTRAELQLLSARPGDALDTLDSLSQAASRYPVALRLRIEATRNLRQWRAVLGLIADARRAQALSSERLDELENEACIGLLEQAAEPGNDVSTVMSQWRDFPARLRRNSHLLGRYCVLLSGREQGGHAEQLLRDRLKKHWESNLVILYGQVDGEDPRKQLVVAEAWLREHPNDAALLLTLGRLCLKNHLWGKARDYLEDSVQREPSAEGCAELGRLYQHLGEHVRSGKMFERSLAGSMRLSALPLPKHE